VIRSGKSAQAIRAFLLAIARACGSSHGALQLEIQPDMRSGVRWPNSNRAVLLHEQVS